VSTLPVLERTDGLCTVQGLFKRVMGDLPADIQGITYRVYVISSSPPGTGNMMIAS
jgi:hypothetical protein